MNLKELSELLGISQTTVSRALNGYPEVSEATRRRVESAAREHNYRPNRGASSLATGRSMTIGHIFPASTKDELISPIFGDFIAGASEIYRSNGYEMLFSLVSEGDEDEMYKSLLRRGAVDGIVVQGPTENDERISILNEIGLPFIVHGRSTKMSEDYSWVDVNNRRAFQRATDFLLDLGHERIGLVNGLKHMDFAKRRFSGYQNALSARGVDVDPAFVRSSDMTELHGYQSAREMLQFETPPTAILAASMISAIGVRRAVQDAGLSVGSDVSIVTYDDEMSYLRNGQDVPIFTAIRSPVREAGRIVADALLRRIKDPSAPHEHIQLEAELVLGQSTGPAPRP